MKKLCSCCSQPAQYSLALVLSTVGLSKRRQKCSPVVLFCDDCLSELCESECWGSSALRQAVNSAYTALELTGRQSSTSESAAD